MSKDEFLMERLSIIFNDRDVTIPLSVTTVVFAMVKPIDIRRKTRFFASLSLSNNVIIVCLYTVSSSFGSCCLGPTNLTFWIDESEKEINDGWLFGHVHHRRRLLDHDILLGYYPRPCVATSTQFMCSIPFLFNFLLYLCF